MKDDMDSDDSICIVASFSDRFHRTYNAMDVVLLRQNDAMGLSDEEFDDDEMEEDLVVNSATPGTVGTVVDVDDVHKD